MSLVFGWLCYCQSVWIFTMAHRRGVDRVNPSYPWRTNLSVFLKASRKFQNSSNKSHEFPEFFDILLEFCRVILFMKVINILPKELPAGKFGLTAARSLHVVLHVCTCTSTILHTRIVRVHVRIRAYWQRCTCTCDTSTIEVQGRAGGALWTIFEC